MFYSYWLSFSTCKSYAWEDKYELKQAPNRRVQRLMEKENKKLRDAGRKKRNEVVRVSQGNVWFVGVGKCSLCVATGCVCS